MEKVLSSRVAGAPPEAVLANFIAWVYACFLFWLVATIKLVYCPCDTCAVARYPGICSCLPGGVGVPRSCVTHASRVTFTDIVSNTSCGRRLWELRCPVKPLRAPDPIHDLPGALLAHQGMRSEFERSIALFKEGLD